MRKKVLRAAGYLLTVLLFLTGILVYGYPLLGGYIVDKNMTSALEDFYYFKELAATQGSSAPARTEKASDNTNDGVKLDELYEDMQKYNENIAGNGQSGLEDAWSYEQSGIDLSGYGLYDTTVGAVRIPELEVELPLYLGASESNMSRGAVQLGQTSMPIGGTDTNCVIAAHRGYSGSSFFREIERLETGDEIYLDNFWETLTYRVTGIAVISPEEIDRILIQEGKDMVTLITCHPYTRNYQRYVVYCERVQEEGEQERTDGEMETESAGNANSTAEKGSDSELLIKLEKGLYVVVPVFLAVLAVCLFRRLKKQKKQTQQSMQRRCKEG